jgi:hypothetical protein
MFITMLKHKMLKIKRKVRTLCLCLIPSVMMAQSSVTGIVTENSNDEGLPGVSIIEKGTVNGTVTDVDGKYSIELKNPTSVLVFSYLGMVSQEKIAKAGDIINVSLAEDAETIDEIIVTGYTSQKKADLTGAVSVVKVSDMVKSAENILNTLEGRASGVQINADGSPGGGGTSIQIR